MLMAMVILLVFLSTRTKVISAILGGIGFGLFIDELGKFITHDNNYFYQPAIALIYLILLSLFFLFRMISRKQTFSQKEYLMNALMLLEEAVLNDMDNEEKEKYQEFLTEAGDYHHLTAKLNSLTGTLTVTNPKPPGAFTKTVRSAASYYDRFLKSSLFNKVILIFFVAHFVTTLFTASLIIYLEINKTPSVPTPVPGNYLYLAWGELFSTILSAGLAIAGVIYLRFSKFTAYRLLKYSVLVTILLTTFFSFYKMQLAALFGLIINLFLLVGLNQILGRNQPE